MPNSKPRRPARRTGAAALERASSIASEVVKKDAQSTGDKVDDIRVFLSYSRKDDRAFDLIVPFKELLEVLVHAKTGRRITSFLDQRDIQWGETWKNRLSEEILAASVFIPLLSANYLESENCRMEFNKFSSASSSLGVAELLLPVLVFDAPDIFNEASTDDIVLAAIDRQYETLEDAVLSARGSSEWKRTMARIAGRFASAYRAAESTLAVLPPGAISGAVQRGDGDDDLESPGLTELMQSFSDEVAVMTEASKALQPAMENFTEAAKSVPAPENSRTSKELQLWSFRLANAIREPAVKIGEHGERLFDATRALDQTVTDLYRISGDIPAMRASLDQTLTGFGDLSAVRAQMTALLDSMRPAEALSVPLRKAIRPARNGVTKVNDSLALVASWAPTDGELPGNADH